MAEQDLSNLTPHETQIMKSDTKMEPLLLGNVRFLCVMMRVAEYKDFS